MWQIAIDFDGTIVEHDYPRIGKEVPGAVDCIKELKASKQCHLILWTMRSGETLDDAVQWCKDKGIEFDFANFKPEDRLWTTSPKVFANVYVDDAALGCPIVKFEDHLRRRPYADWSVIGPELMRIING